MRPSAIATTTFLFAVVGLALGCAKARTLTPPRPEAPPAATPRASTAAQPQWPVPMRIMAWTPDGTIDLGPLTDAPPPTLPSTPWFVQPMQPIQPAHVPALVEMLRRHNIPGLSLEGQAVRSWLPALNAVPTLSAIVLDDTDVDNAALTQLTLSLRRLYAAGTSIDNAGVVALVAAQPQLEVVSLENCHVGDLGLAPLTRLADLRALNLAQTQITDAGGSAIRLLTTLEVLDLGRTAVGARTIDAIRGLPLRELFLDQTAVGREVSLLSSLAATLQRFEISNLRSYRPTDANLRWLARARGLVEIGVSAAAVTDDLMMDLASFPALRILRAADTRITEKTLERLAARRDLHELDLASTAVADAHARRLLTLPALRSLRLDSTAITDAALTAIALPPSLTQLYLSNTFVGDQGLAILDQARQLVALGVGSTQAGDVTIRRIAALPQLHTLILSHSRASRAALRSLGTLTKLERLYVDGTNADDSVVGALATSPSLRVIHLGGSDIGDAALSALRRFHALEELTVGDTNMKAGITDLRSWPRLRTLSLTGLRIDDGALASLANAQELKVLDLSATDVHDPSALATLPRLAELGLLQVKLSAAGAAAADALVERGVVVHR